MRADKVGRDTMLSQIVEMVASAQRSRGLIQGLADKVAGWFVPAVILVAVIAFIVWSVLGPTPPMAFGLIAAGVLYPFAGILLSPIIAAAAMSLSSVSVITNALRLRVVKLSDD
jgi:cation transport ATPase